MGPRLFRWAPLPVLAAGALGAWGLAAGRPDAAPVAPQPAPPAVPVQRVDPRSVQIRVRAYGSVEPRAEISLVAEIAGRVTRVAPELEAGGFFEAGALLVEIEREDAELALERARGGLLRVQSEVDLARAQLERLRALASRDISSASKLEEAESGHRIARARLREARAEVGQAERELARTRIRAPFTGRVREKQVEAGQFVSRGTALARIHAVDRAQVRLPIPSSELAFLVLPDARGGGPGARVTLRASYAGRPGVWEGHLVRSEGEFEESSRMLHVVAEVDDPYDLRGTRGGPPLPVGLFVEAEIEGRRFADVFVLPRAALRTPTQVVVVDADGRLRARQVDVLRVEGDRVLVRSGLRAGERVVASAAGSVDGAQVRAVPAEIAPQPMSLAESRP